MIAPIKETRRAHEPSPLQAARLAVADALLSPRRKLASLPAPLARWRVWLTVAALVALAAALLLTFDWWAVEHY